MTTTRYSQFCALARAAELLGERWTLLIIRELLLGPKRFGDLNARLHGMSPTLLTARLNGLVERGLVERTGQPSPGYRLTEIGQGLRPAIRELIRWGGHFLFPMRPEDEFEPDWVLLGLEAVLRRTATPAVTVVLRVRHGDRSGAFTVAGGPDGAVIAAGDGSGQARLTAGFDTLLRILSGALTAEAAVAQGLADLEGSVDAVGTLPRLFDFSR